MPRRDRKGAVLLLSLRLVAVSLAPSRSRRGIIKLSISA